MSKIVINKLIENLYINRANRAKETNSVNTTKSYKTLMDAYGITSTNWSPIEKFPLRFVHSGRYYGGNLINTSDGYYWSSTAGTAGGVYYLAYTSDYVGSQSNNINYSGYSVRCIAR